MNSIFETAGASGSPDSLSKLDDAALSEGTTASPKSDIATSPSHGVMLGGKVHGTDDCGSTTSATTSTTARRIDSICSESSEVTTTTTTTTTTTMMASSLGPPQSLPSSLESASVTCEQYGAEEGKIKKLKEEGGEKDGKEVERETEAEEKKEEEEEAFQKESGASGALLVTSGTKLGAYPQVQLTRDEAQIKKRTHTGGSNCDACADEGSDAEEEENCLVTASFVSSCSSSGTGCSSTSCGSSAVVDQLVDNILAALVRSIDDYAADATEVIGPLRSLIALLPQQAAVQALLQLATLKQEPYKAELQRCLHEAGAVVALMAAAMKGTDDSQRLAKLALSAISLSSAPHLLDREAMPPSPAGLTPLPTPTASPVSTPSQASALGHSTSDILDPMTSFFAQAITSLQRLSAIDALSAAELAAIPVDIMSVPFERRSTSHESEDTLSVASTCESAGQSESQEPTRPPPPGAKMIQGWAASSYRRGSLGFEAMKKAMTQKWHKVGTKTEEGSPSLSCSEPVPKETKITNQVLTDEV